MKHHCPDCITELITDTRRLGRGSRKWFICPKCGYRDKAWQTLEDEKIDKELSAKIRELNASGGMCPFLDDLEEFNLETLINSHYENS